MAPARPRHPRGTLLLGDPACGQVLCPLSLGWATPEWEGSPRPVGQRLRLAVAPGTGELGREVSSFGGGRAPRRMELRTRIPILLPVTCLLLWSEPWTWGCREGGEGPCSWAAETPEALCVWNRIPHLPSPPPIPACFPPNRSPSRVSSN